MANEETNGVTTDEEVQAALNAPENLEEELAEEVTPPEEPATDQPADEPLKIEIDGESLTLDEIRAGYMRHQDYTRKTQEISQFKQIMDAWEHQPQARPLILAELAKEAGLEVPGIQPQTQAPALQGASTEALLGGPNFRPDPHATYNDGTPIPEWHQRGYDSQNEMMLHGQMIAMAQQFGGTLNEVQRFIQGQTAEKTRDTQAMQGAQDISTKYGLTGVTPERVRDAMIQTGLNDPEAAFLKANAASLFKATKPGVAEKPDSPAPSAGKTFDPWRNDYTADEINDLLRKGFSPVPR